MNIREKDKINRVKPGKKGINIMKKTLKLCLVALLVICTMVVCALAVSAADLQVELQAKITAGTATLTKEGYCITNEQKPTNIKYYIYKVSDAPEYWMYFAIDGNVTTTGVLNADGTLASGDATGYLDAQGVIMAGDAIGNADGYTQGDGWVFGWWTTDLNNLYNKNSGQYARQTWYDAEIDKKYITTAIIGDGITQIGHTTQYGDRGVVFTGMNGLKTVEFSSGCKVFSGEHFKGCVALTTAYTRGQTPIDGTVDLSQFETVYLVTYSFDACTSVKRYVFPADIGYTGWIGDGQPFRLNNSLEELTIPGNINTIAVKDLPKLKKITFENKYGNYILATAGRFANLPELEEVVFTNKITDMNDAIPAVAGATTVAEVTADNEANLFRNCPKLKKITSPQGSSTCLFAVKYGFEDIHTFTIDGEWAHSIVSYDHTNKALMIEPLRSGWAEFDMGNGTFNSLMNEIRSEVVSLTISGMNKVANWTATNNLFNNCTALETVIISNGTNIHQGSASPTYGFFEGCTNLKTVWFGAVGEALPESAVGTVNMTGWGESTTYTGHNLFKGCTSIQKVVLTNSANLVYDETTFAGCTGIKEIVIPDTVTELPAGVFVDASALVKADIKSAEFTVLAGQFPDVTGAVILCPSKAIADSINSSYTNTKGVFFGGIVSAEGFSVRYKTYNGLRNLFKFDYAASKVYEDMGWTLVEYGAMAIPSFKLEAAGGILTVLANEDGTFSASIPGAVKRAVWNETNLWEGRVLSYTEGNSAEYALTLTNFTDNFDTDVYACAYAIYRTASGEYLIDYATYAEEGNNYRDVLVSACQQNIFKDKDGNPVQVDEAVVWKILYDEASVLAGSAREHELDGGVRMMAVDNGTHKLLLVRRADSTLPSSDDITAAEAKAAELGLTGYTTVALNVKYDPELSYLDLQWQNYIDEKLAGLELTDSEKKRSFIFITDNHDIEKNSSSYGDIGLRTQLMDYVRNKVGFKTVIHGGDIFDQYTVNDGQDADRSVEVWNRYVNNELYGTFGQDMIFAVGNHDGNFLGWRGTASSTGNPKDYFVSETDMYNNSIANLGNNVKYDEQGIAAIQKTMEYFGVTDPATIQAGIDMVKMHYYYDDTANKTRYIILDTGANGYEAINFLKLDYGNFMMSELKWFGDVLLDVKTNHSDYNVVVVGHQMLNDSNMTDNSAGGIGKYYDLMSAFKSGGTCDFSTARPWMCGVSDDGNGGKKWNYHELLVYLDYLDGTLNFMDGRAVEPFTYVIESYDFGGTKYEGTIFTISGHCHSDNAFYKNNFDATVSDEDRKTILADVALGYEGTLNDRAILTITTGTTSGGHISAVDTATYGYNMQSGANFYDILRFDIVTIMDDGSVKTTRIGYGTDRFFRP